MSKFKRIFIAHIPVEKNINTLQNYYGEFYMRYQTGEYNTVRE